MRLAALLTLSLLLGATPAPAVGTARVLALDWQVNPGRATLTITVAGRPGFTVAPREGGSAGLTIDILGARPAPGLAGPVPAGEGGVLGVAIRHHPGSPGFTRVTLELEEPVSYRARFDPFASAMLVDILYQITRVACEGEGRDTRVTIEANGPVGFQVLPPGGENRLVIDFPGATLSARQPPGVVAAPTFPVRELRTLQHPAGVRVVVDLEDGAGAHVVPAQRGVEVSFAARVKKVALATSTGGTPRLLVYTSAGVVVEETFLVNPQRLILDLPGAVLGDVPAEVGGLGILKLVRVHHLPGDPSGVRLEVSLDQYAGHTLSWNRQGTLLTVDFHPPDLRGRTVVVDAGHGGYDPGAVSGRGSVLEKDVTLDLALRLGARLEEAGATVVYTRDSDVFVGNEERVQLANRIGAHALVSIHLNSYRDPSVRGAETYRARANPGGTRLAEFLQAALVENTGLPDRGLRWENFVVLREATMPAVMVEVLYLSNPADASLILDPAFRDRVAEGLYTGLLCYFATAGEWHGPPER